MRWLVELLPVLHWGRHYPAGQLKSDVVAGLVVLFITVPQSIAYAYLAGMPPEAGLYGAFMALLGYAFFGSSRALAVGPAAIISMMTLEAASRHVLPGESGYSAIVVQICGLTGLVLIGLRIINFGAVVAFLSHAVVTGFISAAALLIMLNQVPSILGLASSPDTSLAGVSFYLANEATDLNVAVVLISAGAILLLVFCRTLLDPILARLGIGASVRDSLVKSAPMYAVVVGVLVVALASLDEAQGVPVVGAIPTSLPTLALVLPEWDRLPLLLPSALLIAMVIFMESTSIGTAVASRTREKINPNQELVGLGAANLGAFLVGAFPVAGSFARTVVNFSTGARSQIASIVTAAGVLVTLLVFAQAFYYLPKGVLSAIIIVSAWQLIDPKVIGKLLRFNRTDAVTFLATFLAVLAFGVETGVLAGIVVSFILLIRSSSKPHIAIVGRVGDSEHFRNVERYETRTSPKVLAVRIDESLYFVNTRFIETYILSRVADAPAVEHVLLICTATNFIDTSGLEMLEELTLNLAEAGVTLHLAEVKGPVMDKLKETEFFKHMKGEIFFTSDLAMKKLAGS